MNRIAIFQSDLNIGGIQKSLINLLNNIDLENLEVDLYLFDETEFFGAIIPEKVNIIRGKAFPRITKFTYFSIIKKLTPQMKAVRPYDVAIDFNSYWNECAFGAISVPAKKRIMWIHNDVEKKRKEDPKYRILWHFFKGKLEYFDEYVAVSRGIVEPFRRLSKIEDKRIRVIPNFIDTREILEKSKKNIPLLVDPLKYNLVSMGRLCHQKGFDILLDYMQDVIKERTDIMLYIIGDGPDKEALEKQILNNNLSPYVTLLGNQTNPYPYLNVMDGFVLTSRYEGQGMVIWEAKTLGLKIFIPRNLEKYNEGIEGCDDLVKELVNAEKTKKEQDTLEHYNQDIKTSLEMLLSQR